MEYRVKNLFLCKIVWNSNRRRHGQKSKLDVILEDIQSSNSFSDEEISQIRQKLINNFFPQFNRQWTRVTRNKSLFLQKYETFLQKDFVVVFNRNARNTKVDENRCVRTPKVGRPRVNYEEGSVKTKRRRIQDIAMNYSAEELKRALELINLPVDDDSASDVEDEVDSNKVLAMYSNLSLTVDKYRKLRLHNEQLFGKKIYPPYRKIQAAKVNCYPEHIDITDLGAKVDFISLIDHTVRRILLSNFQESDLEKLQNKKLFLLGKWGMDGASGQQTTRQKWSNSLRYQLSDADDAVLSSTINRSNNNNKSDNEYDSENNDVYDDNATKQMKISDETVFMVSMVPLQLKADDSIIWENETPSSIHWCRPVEFNFTKETHEIVIATYEKYENLL